MAVNRNPFTSFMEMNAAIEAQMRSMRLSQQNAAMDAYVGGLLAEMQRPQNLTPIPDEFSGGGRWVFPYQQAVERMAQEQSKNPKEPPPFEDAFVYRPKVEPKKPFDWTLPLPEPWASRFCKLYFAMLAATPLYVLWALL